MTGASKRDNSIVPLPNELKQQLRDEFDRRYKYKNRRRWTKFECDWGDTLGDCDSESFPSKPTIRNVLDSPKKQDCEYRIADGLCRLLLECDYDAWMAKLPSPPGQSQQEPSQPSPTLPTNVEPPEPSPHPEEREIFPSFSEDSDCDRPEESIVTGLFSTPHSALVSKFEVPQSEPDDRPRSSPRRWKPLAKLAATATIAGIGGYFSIFPHLAGWANQLGRKYHQHREFPTAQFFYRSATFLNPRKGVYPYNLGWMCDEIADRDCAIDEFQRAALRGFPDAYAELGRLHLLEAQHPEALRATRQCLQEAQRDGERAACLKNLGWLRVAQQEWEEAESVLREAISLNPDSAHSNCLLARVLEVKDEVQAAVPLWIETLKYADPAVPEHDECIRQGNQRLGTLKIPTSP